MKMVLKLTANNLDELTKFVTDDIDGRFWMEDRIEELIRGTRFSQAFDDFVAEHDEQIENVEEEAYDRGFETGVEEAEYLNENSED